MRSFFGSSLCLGLAVLLTACGSYRNSSQKLVESAAVFDLQADQWISWTEVKRKFREYDVVILGEIHDQKKHHWIQARVLRELAEKNPQLVVGLEHLRQDQQKVLDQYRKGQMGLDELREALFWDRSGWPAWEMFEPIFAEAYAAEVRLVALDLEAEQLGELRRGQAGAAFLERMGLNEKLSQEAQQGLESTLKEGHDFEISEEMLYAMQLIQRARDATMASRLHSALRNSGATQALMFCGSGHARKDWGVVKDFKMLEEGLKVLSVGMVPEKPRALTSKEKREELFDWVWWTGS